MSVTVIGDAFIDVIVPVLDIKPGETHHRKIITLSGGIANVAFQISSLGEKVSFLGKIGNDPFGRHFKRKLKTNGVEDLTLVDYRNATGLCVSLVYMGGERAMVANRGANDCLTRGEIERHLNKITKSKIVYFSGYSFGSPLTSDSILYAIGACRGKCEIWFNPGALNTIQSSFRGYISDFVDVLVSNLDEARILTNKYEVQDIANDLKDLVGLAVITLGKEGCLVVTKEGNIHIPVSGISEVRDTTGAGDALAGGFIVGRLRRLNLTKCAKLGNEAAANFLKQRAEALK